MFLAAIGLTVIAMVGPLDETPVVRISRPGCAPEFVRLVEPGDRTESGGIVVPDSAVGGGGVATVVSASDTYVSEYTGNDEPQGLYTEQLLRGFGYDTGNFGYSTINYPGRGGGGIWNGGGAGGGGGNHHPGGGNGHGSNCAPRVDPRVRQSIRNLAPIESRFPTVVGR